MASRQNQVFREIWALQRERRPLALQDSNLKVEPAVVMSEHVEHTISFLAYVALAMC